jgi:regulator of replication initiation timing
MISNFNSEEGVVLFYDPAMEKIKAIDFVNQSLSFENSFEKSNKVERAIQIALEEIQELDQRFCRFVEENKHLHVFEHLLKPLLVERHEHMIMHARSLMEKTYTQEELQQYPEHVYQDIVNAQKKRVEVLKKIAASYFA